MINDKIHNTIQEHNGIITTEQIESKGISKTAFYNYIREFQLLKLYRGIYATPEAWIDNSYVLSLRCPEIIYSHEEALYLHGLAEREPLIHTVTVKTGYNPSHLSDNDCKVYTIKKELYDMGKTELQSTFGNILPVYGLDRTICDIVRSRSNIELQDFQSALKGYAASSNKNLNNLMKYAEKMGIAKLMRHYMEILL